MKRRCCIVVTLVGLAALWPGGCDRQASSPPPLLPEAAVSSPMAQAQSIVQQALVHPDPRVRANAIEVVATTGQVRLAPGVQRLLGDSSLPVRFNAVVAVGDLRYRFAADAVTGLVRDPDRNVQIAAAYALLRLGRSEYFKVVRDAITAEDQTVRANAALLLGKSGRPEALRFLWWALRHRDSADKVVLQVAESIAMLGDERIYPKLWSRLISAYADDRVIGIRAMGALGTAEAKNALVTMLDDPVLEVRLAAAEQLGKRGEPIGEPEVLDVFEKDLPAQRDPQDRERVTILAALAVGEIGTDPLVKYLPGLLADPSQHVRLAAAKAVLRSARR